MTIPSLYRLCAECLAVVVLTQKQRRLKNELEQCLKFFDLPDLLINYISTNKIYKVTNFSNIPNCLDCARVQRTRPDSEDKCKLDVIIENNEIYVCTLPNLGQRMMRLDIENGTYELQDFNEGYILHSGDDSVKFQDLAHVFSSKSRHYGLSADFDEEACDDYVNDWQATLYDDYLGRCEITNFFYSARPTYDTCRLMLKQGVLVFDCIPVLFYLNRRVYAFELPYISLVCRTKVSGIGNVHVCFYVYHSKYGRIGLAVQQRNFLAGHVQVNVLWSETYTALGNFKVFDIDFYSSSAPYLCKFNPCRCVYNFVYNKRQST
ncbi:asb010 [Agrotis segetum nucleopolyhedrovirus B]|uniref:Asb010 n=2 Tax=Alphabaculovirus TaxID=558016 RepID=A0A0A7KR36_9ABAC|nr:asb010 [Agrotis segetum nucleopolyhedrovirus B]AIZ48568.1 asb010 [Agrotis segetum nucleopolyhedrovirus B]